MKRPALTRIFLCLLAGFAGCQKQSGYQEPPPPMVDILDAVSIPLTDEMTFNGTTRARASVDLRAKVTGYLKEIRFQDGQRVKKGDLLFVIERDPFERELEARQADLKRAQAGLNLAEANQRRTEKLRAENATTQQQLDVVVAEKATSEANVAAADAAVKQAELNLDYTLITAPMEGRIGRHLVDEGNLVQAGTMSLAVIESIAPIDVYYYISEADVLRLMTMVREGRLTSPEIEAPKIFMGLQDDDDYPYEGLLKFRDLGVDPGTGTILRRAEFANEKGDLIPGLFVRMKAPLGEKQPRVLIEDVAIITDQSGDSVLVVERRPKADRKTGKLLDPPQYEYAAKRRPVQVGRRLNHMRVIESGLKAGEWVITAGIQKARDGSPVNFVRELVEKAAKKRAEELKPETGTDIPAPLPEPIEADAKATPPPATATGETPPAKQESAPAEAVRPEAPKAEVPAAVAPGKEPEKPEPPATDSKSSARSLSESTPA